MPPARSGWRAASLTTLAVLALVVVVAPALEASGNGPAAWVCAPINNAAIGLVVETVRWRRGFSTGPLFALAFLLLFVLGAGLAARAFIR